jgi:sulfur carrier protein ThiS
MKVDIALFAYLSEYQPDGQGGRQARSFELEPGTSVTDIVVMLGLPDEPRVVFRNGKQVAEDAVLVGGDRVAVFPPVAGG